MMNHHLFPVKTELAGQVRLGDQLLARWESGVQGNERSLLE